MRMDVARLESVVAHIVLFQQPMRSGCLHTATTNEVGYMGRQLPDEKVYLCHSPTRGHLGFLKPLTL